MCDGVFEDSEFNGAAEGVLVIGAIDGELECTKLVVGLIVGNSDFVIIGLVVGKLVSASIKLTVGTGEGWTPIVTLGVCKVVVAIEG